MVRESWNTLPEKVKYCLGRRSPRSVTLESIGRGSRILFVDRRAQKGKEKAEVADDPYVEQRGGWTSERLSVWVLTGSRVLNRPKSRHNMARGRWLPEDETEDFLELYFGTRTRVWSPRTGWTWPGQNEDWLPVGSRLTRYRHGHTPTVGPVPTLLVPVRRSYRDRTRRDAREKRDIIRTKHGSLVCKVINSVSLSILLHSRDSNRTFSSEVYNLKGFFS